MKKLSIILILTISTVLFGADYKPIELSDKHNHDKFNTEPDDIIKVFRAYIVSFDGKDDFKILYSRVS